MKPNERIAQLHHLSKIYAKAKSESEYLNHFRKSKLAMLKIAYSKSNPEWANCKAEDAARCDKEYLSVLDGLKIAIEASEAAKWELMISQSGIGIWQTQQATKRQEMTMLGKDV